MEREIEYILAESGECVWCTYTYISTFSFLPIKVFSIPFRIVNGMSPSCNPDPEDREVRGEDTVSIRDN
jgi:hypothetical protein